MLVKSQVKYIQSLGHKKFRDADGVFIAEGPKIVNELLVADNIRLVQCFATPDWLSLHETELKGKEKAIVQISENDLERISFQHSPNQVLGIFEKPVFKVLENTEGITLLLDHIQDPGNLGTIIRTADWFGLKRIVCSMETADVFNPKVVQSAMGSIIRVEMIYTDLEVFIRANRSQDLFAASLEGEDLHEKWQVNKALLLMGNESKGISEALASMATKQIRIPRSGGAESLNVAVATGILLSRMVHVS